MYAIETSTYNEQKLPYKQLKEKIFIGGVG